MNRVDCWAAIITATLIGVGLVSKLLPFEMAATYLLMLLVIETALNYRGRGRD